RARLRLQPFDLALGLGDQDAHADDLHDFVIIAAHVPAVALEHLLLVGIRRVVAEAVVPPVGVLRYGAQEVFLAVAAHHDGWDGIGSGLAVGAADLVVLALIRRRRLGPHEPDQLDGLAELRDAHGRGRKGPAVGAILLLVPAGTDAQDDPAAGQRLRRR